MTIIRHAFKNIVEYKRVVFQEKLGVNVKRSVGAVYLFLRCFTGVNVCSKLSLQLNYISIAFSKFVVDYSLASSVSD